jgi:hypothetical protein
MAARGAALANHLFQDGVLVAQARCGHKKGMRNPPRQWLMIG